MLKKFLANLIAAQEKKRIDPAAFNDAIALQTSWQPLISGGTSFRTHALRRVGAERMEFRPTLGALLFGVFFIGLGTFVSLAFIGGSIQSRQWFMLIPALIPLLFVAVGAAILYHSTTPVVFDQQRGYFWKTRNAARALLLDRADDNIVALSRIHALQIIREHCRGSKSSFTSFELNLVLDDASRVNVVDHGDARALRRDAAQLAQFLDKPLWDAGA